MSNSKPGEKVEKRDLVVITDETEETHINGQEQNDNKTPEPKVDEEQPTKSMDTEPPKSAQKMAEEEDVDDLTVSNGVCYYR